MKKVICALLLVIIVSPLHAQDKISIGILDTVTVTGTRLDSKFALTRNVTSITQQDIKKLPVQSLPQLLNYALGVSMNSRGFAGVQSDPSLRGAGFEQILVMLNGVRINDPQSGHHNMNIPVSLQDIERVEVLRGQSSALYGPDAFGGAINIITKTRQGKQINAQTTAGSFGSTNSQISFSLPKNNFNTRFSYENARSDGYRRDTDYLQNNFNFQADYTSRKNRLTFFTGFLDRDFGANDFYVQNTDSFEKIHSFITNVRGTFQLTPKFTLSTNTYFKQHKDFFNLLLSNPSVFQADHKTRRYVTEAVGKYRTESQGTFTVGSEIVYEDITSSSLGDHDVNRYSFFSEYGMTIKNNLLILGGIRLDNHSEWGTELNPSLSAGYIIGENNIIKASIGRSFRGPSFIELYNPTPTNKGNADLKPEKAIAFDIGADYSLGDRVRGEFSYFFRDQSETIDWIKETPEAGWNAINLFDITSQGIEQKISVDVDKSFRFSLSYNYLKQSKDQEGFISKYVFIHPQHQFSFNPEISFTDNLQLYSIVTWKDRKNLNEYLTLDAKLVYQYKNLILSVEGLNLTDKDYQEIRHVPMPGRAVLGGIKFTYK